MRLIVFPLLVMIFCGCKRIEEDHPIRSKLTVVMHDQSVSVVFVEAHITHFIEKLVNERITQNQDVLIRVPVGDKGFDVSKLKAYKLDVDELDKSSVSEFAKVKIEKLQAIQLKNAQVKLTQELAKVFSRSGTEPKTHLMSSLATVNEIRRQYPDHETELVILSDLVLDGEIRSLYTNQFHSAREAQKAAQLDVVRLDSLYGVSKSAFTQIGKVTVVFPQCDEGQQNSIVNSGFNSHYFREVFSQMGCSSFYTYHECK